MYSNTSGDEFSCEIGNSPSNANKYCEFIKKKCNSEYFWIAERYYCSSASNKVPSLIILTIILIVIFWTLVLLFVSLSILVAKFLYPILHSLCIEYRINDKFLSCILVPFINCFPDIVNYYIAMKSNSIDLTLGQVIGSILIIFTLVLGSICFLQPFEIGQNKTLLMNDFVSVFIVILIFSYIVSDGVITKTECVVMVMVYFVYVIYLYLIIDKANIESSDEEEAIPDIQIEQSSSSNLLTVPSFGIEDALSVISDDMETSEQARSVNYGTFDQENFDSNVQDGVGDDGESFHGTSSKTIGLSTSELSLRSSIWDENRNYPVNIMKHGTVRVFQVIFNLIDLSFYLIVPFIENEGYESGEAVRSSEQMISAWLNWRASAFPVLFSGYISNLRCFLIPIMLHLIYFPELPYTYILPAILLMMIWNSLLMPYTPALLTKVLAIFLTLNIISILAGIILQMLKNLGVILRISETLLGLTIFAISNSINDIITNVTLANLGKPILGVNACLGTPLLSILLGVGFNGLLVTFQKGLPDLKLDVNLHIIVTTVGLVILLAFYLIYIPLNGWRFDRKLGISVICWWAFITIINCIVN
ncbi:hypothetical protein CLIB1423_12S01464 [[Candida] railenensis]|uniref:Sodium/calcium exchanger membrane region domain-containing protein n=1 Tax=[Candida] railenensis TaxID=45579 RepID=A0A9P0QS23_9ASCO|nr:hypothetical protein CLIB1423_12S01464 [[Candida] railenensis]